MAPSGWPVNGNAVAESAQDATDGQDSAQVSAKSVRVFSGTAKEAQDLLEQACREEEARKPAGRLIRTGQYVCQCECADCFRSMPSPAMRCVQCQDGCPPNKRQPVLESSAATALDQMPFCCARTDRRREALPLRRAPRLPLCENPSAEEYCIFCGSVGCDGESC